MTFFRRNVAITFGDADQAVRVEKLHVDFTITHQIRSANTASVKVYNLSEATRRVLSDDGQNDLPLRMKVEAGYGDELELLYRGRVRKAASQHVGPDWVSTIESGDGEAELRKANVNVTFPAGASVEDVMQGLIEQTGLAAGDLIDRVRENGLAGTITEFARGFSFSGNAGEGLSKLVRSFGMTPTVQDGKFTAFESARGVKRTGFRLSPSSGLVGSPEVGDKGSAKVRSLLLPSVRPGHRIDIESTAVNGTYRVQKVLHTGSLRGQDWYSDLELKPV